MSTNNCATRPRRNYNRLIAPTFSSLLNDIFQAPAVESRVSHSKVRPAVNILKTEDAYSVSLALPGIGKENIDIKVEDRKLTISSIEREEAEINFRLREFNFEQFERAFTLPKNVDGNAIEATYEAGILTLTLPIIPEAKPKSVKVK